MGLCNCNEKNGMIIRAEYEVPNVLLDKNGKETMKRGRSLNTQHQTKKDAISENKTFISDNPGKLSEQTYHKSRRSMLLNQITRNTLSQTKTSTQIKSFGAESKFMKEVNLLPLSPDELNVIKKALSNHFLFNKFNDILLQQIIEKMKKYQIEEQFHLFLEGEEGQTMYIIASGKVEVYKTGTKKVLVKSTEECFGELGVLVPNSLRTYNVKAISNGFVYGIDSQLFRDIKLKLIKPDNELMNLIEIVPLFNYLEKSDKEYLCRFAKMITIKQYELYTSKDVFFIIKSGSIISKMGNQQIEMKSHSFFGLRRLLFDSSQTSYEIQAKTQSEVYIFSLDAFIEILGIDVQYQLIYPYFKSLMTQNSFFSSLFNELQLVPIFQLFKLKEYKQNSIVCYKHTSGKIIIVLSGQLFYQFNNSKDTVELEFGSIYGDRLITYGLELNNEIIARYNSIIIEAEWEEIKSKVISFNSSIAKKMKHLAIVGLLRNVNESKLLEIASIVKKVKFSKGELICSKDFNNDKFFFVIKGEAKLKMNNKAIRRYGKGNCFGEIYLLNIEDPSMIIISSSEKISLYVLSGSYFTNLIQKSTYNEFIQNKMCNEDREITYGDLYLIKVLSKKSYLVHNTIQLYMVDTRIKSQKELKNAINTVKASKHLDHPFIVKYVKMVESKYNAVFIYEYIQKSISMSQLIHSKQQYINKVSSIIFYGACLIEAISYMNSKYFTHGNITPENILIDSNGYIKLINLSLSMKIKNNSSTNSVIGVPCYSAPEVLKGNQYSFSCDYWSIGVVLFHFYFGYLPFDIKDIYDPFAVYNAIINNELDYSQCDSKVKEVFISLINPDATRRCQSLASAKKLICFKDYDFEVLFSKKIEPPLIPPNEDDFNTEEVLTNKSKPLDKELERKDRVLMEDLIESWDNYF